MPRARRSLTLLGLLAAVAGGPPALAADPAYLICPLVLHEETAERDDLALEAQLAGTELAATEEIFSLLESLLANNAVERMLHLKWKRNRDAARIDRERRTLRVSRQEALIDQYRILCSASPGEPLPADRHRAFVAALARYREADCAIIEAAAAIAAVDLAYQQDVLDSMRDLRASNVATALDIILAEAEVDYALRRIDDGRRRADRCRRDLKAPAGGDPAP